MTTLDRRTDMLEKVRRSLIESGQALGDDERVIDIGEFAVPEGAAAVLEAAATAAAAETMIEVGMASGLSTLAICRGRLAIGDMTPGSFHVIDPCQDHFANCGLRSLERAGIRDLITFHGRPAHAALPQLLEHGARVQFAFIDGLHFLDNVILELWYMDLMLDIGGVIALHDMWMPALQHAVSFWAANRSYEPVIARNGVFLIEPCTSEHRGCGAPETRPALFKERLEPHVDWSVLLLRKTAQDDRAWDFFESYADR